LIYDESPRQYPRINITKLSHKIDARILPCLPIFTKNLRRQKQKETGLNSVSVYLKTFHLAQICDAVREAGYLLQQAQPIFLHGFVFCHNQNFIEEGGDGWDEFGDDL